MLDLKRLNQIKDIPCLIICGKNDKLIPPSHAGKFEEVFENKDILMVENAGHSSHVEKPAMVYDKLKTFLLVK